MKKIEIMKLDVKPVVDAKAEGCHDDCEVYYYEAYSKEFNDEMGPDWCPKKKKWTAKTCWFW